MTEHEEFEEWDGAYVLGALSPEDRRRFETHMEDCPRCRAAVADLAGLPGLLGRAAVPPEDIEATDPVEDRADTTSLFEGTLRRVDAQRSRRRMAWTLTAAAAAVLLAIAIVLVPRIVATDPPDATVALDPAVSTAMTAGIELRSVAWGTKIRIDCDYPASPEWKGQAPPAYVLEITDSAGNTSQAATWNAVVGKEVTVDAATAVRLSDIVTIAVRTTGGTTVLEKDE